MNTKQWRILLVAVVLFSLSELFPPWQFEHESGFRKCPAGYQFFYSPPVVTSSGELNSLCRLSDEPDPKNFTAHKNLYRLNWQRTIIIFLTVGLWLILFDRRSFLKSLFGGISLFIGVIGLLLYMMLLSIEGL
jgi:hypothetical protein